MTVGAVILSESGALESYHAIMALIASVLHICPRILGISSIYVELSEYMNTNSEDIVSSDAVL